MVKRGNFLDRDLLAGRFVEGRTGRKSQSITLEDQAKPDIPDDSISAFTNDILDVILVGNVE